MRWWLLSVLAACDGPSDATDVGLLGVSFAERLTDGYTCDEDWYLAHDEDLTIRLQTSIAHPDPNEPDDVTVATLGTGEVFYVYLGVCLYAPGCTDVITSPCGAQDIHHVYTAVAGEASLRWTNGEALGGDVEGLVLEGRDGEPAVEIAELTLPALEPWIP